MLISNLDLLATAPGGVARLRELILTLAVQGKLVPQDPSDEPASDLLKKIRAEKDRLIAAKTLKREKDEPVLSDDALPFELPVSWSWAALGEVIDIVRGITFPATQKTREAAPGRIACLRTSNVQQTIEWEDLLFVDRSFMGREDQLIQHHDIVMSMANSRELVGKVALIDQVPHSEATFGGFLGVLRPRKIDPRYAMAVLRTPYARSLLIDSSSQTTNIANVSLAKLRPLPFPLPPDAEQFRIVNRVDELMRLCDALEDKGQLEATQHALLVSTLLGTLTDSETPEELAEIWQRTATHFDLLLDRPEAVDTLEQTILQLAVRGLLVPQDPQDEPASDLLKKIRAEKDKLIAAGKIKSDKSLPPIAEDEKPFIVPPNWEWVRFSQVANIASNLVAPSFHMEKWQVAPDCIEKGTGRLLEKRTVAQAGVISSNHQFKAGQILYSKIRPSLSKAVLVDFDGLCSADMYPVETQLNSQYLLMYILSQPFLEQVRIAENRVKMPKLNQEALVAFTVALPPLAEQTRIVIRVAQLRRICDDLRQRLTSARERQSQIAQALVEQQSTAPV
jgi:type I restriction enzyme, S subunit